MKSTVYTRTGDAGSTSLVGGTRVSKTSARLEAYGTVDEANSWIGLLEASTAIPEAAHATLSRAMKYLFDIGAALATESGSKWQPTSFPEDAIAALEADIDALDSTLPRHNHFTLPGGHPDSARANIARTVVRRAERRIVALAESEAVDAGIMRYINRLSDYLYILSRAINVANGVEERHWEN
ncbi:MAG: cob(I)yrinic acid a,c-diamide adenosyltransferase [Muribaculaceae bacterium]|nr:cob(I)yrinic acid a,c-diamide adenosyltransferase [Muribaculaceae bacterium]